MTSIKRESIQLSSEDSTYDNIDNNKLINNTNGKTKKKNSLKNKNSNNINKSSNKKLNKKGNTKNDHYIRQKQLKHKRSNSDNIIKNKTKLSVISKRSILYNSTNINYTEKMNKLNKRRVKFANNLVEIINIQNYKMLNKLDIDNESQKHKSKKIICKCEIF